MVRFIFFCMAILALSVAAIPLTTVIDGIAKERAETLAESRLSPTQSADPDYFADAADAPDTNELNAIETAAGGVEGVVEQERPMQGGFTGTAPGALADPEPAPVDDTGATPQDN